MSRKEKSSPEATKAGVKWRLDMFDSVDEDNDSKLNVDEYVNYYKAMEAHLREKMGGAYHLSDEELKESHAAHDFDGNGLITKDEVLWSRKMKHKFYKTMKLTADLKHIFKEDLNLFLSLPGEV
jgi:Ca2+-binding EF-hand superfamily protein